MFRTTPEFSAQGYRLSPKSTPHRVQTQRKVLATLADDQNLERVRDRKQHRSSLVFIRLYAIERQNRTRYGLSATVLPLVQTPDPPGASLCGACVATCRPTSRPAHSLCVCKNKPFCRTCIIPRFAQSARISYMEFRAIASKVGDDVLSVKTENEHEGKRTTKHRKTF